MIAQMSVRVILALLDYLYDSAKATAFALNYEFLITSINFYIICSRGKTYLYSSPSAGIGRQGKFKLC
jgi:hypothetical protein